MSGLVTTENQFYFDQRWRILQKIPVVVRFISYEPALGSLSLPRVGPLSDWIITGVESGGGSTSTEAAVDIIPECQDRDVAVFHKQWGKYQNNPLVVEEGMSVEEASSFDPYGKGGGLVDAELVREFPLRRNSVNCNAA